MKLKSAFAGRRTRNFEQDHRDSRLCIPDTHGYCPCPLEEAAADVAELVCSDVAGTGSVSLGLRPMHKPVIDLDLPCQLVPSGTPGNFHLYIDKDVEWDRYLEILKAMAKAGIVQWGFVNTTEERGYGSVRHPDRPKVVAQ